MCYISTTIRRSKWNHLGTARLMSKGFELKLGKLFRYWHEVNYEKMENIVDRGLEHHTPENSRQRIQTRRAVWDAVLDEQERQNREGTFDPDQLFTLYHYYSVHSSILARRMALFDERDAK